MGPNDHTHGSRPVRVLYVDDFEPERVLLAHRVAGSHIQLTTAPDIDSAIDALHADRYDLVVTDLHLGEGRSGIDLIDACKGGGLHAGPVAVLTGESDVVRLQPLIDSGAAAVLTKPIDAGAFPSIVEQLIGVETASQPDVPSASVLIEALPIAARALEISIQRGDAATATRVLRDLASSAGSFGFTSIARLAEQAVGCWQHGQTDAACDASLGVIGAIDAALAFHARAA
ncbi:MAG: response regulator [Planctomycetota bacterium]